MPVERPSVVQHIAQHCTFKKVDNNRNNAQVQIKAFDRYMKYLDGKRST